MENTDKYIIFAQLYVYSIHVFETGKGIPWHLPVKLELAPTDDYMFFVLLYQLL